MRRYPDGVAGQGVLPEGRARRTCRTGSRRSARSSRRATGAHEEVDRLPARERRARAALDGEHGLHRHEHLVLAHRPARPAGLRALRPRPDARGRRGRRRSQVALLVKRAARRARARVVPEDVRRQGLPRARPDRPALDATTTRASFAELVAGAIARTHPKLATTEWSKAPPARRADRREPERRGQDDRVGLLGAPAPGRAGLDAARLGRGRRRRSTRGVHDGRRARARRAARRPVRRRADDAAVARRRRSSALA